ncbi:hypothetical protein BH11MYX4_BH11MYX4_03890 [soil metagenome]
MAPGRFLRIVREWKLPSRPDGQLVFVAVADVLSALRAGETPAAPDSAAAAAADFEAEVRAEKVARAARVKATARGRSGRG